MFQVPACSLPASSHLSSLFHPRRPLLPRPPHLLLPQHVQVSCQLNRESKYSHFCLQASDSACARAESEELSHCLPLPTRPRSGSQTRQDQPLHLDGQHRLGGGSTLGWSEKRVEGILQDPDSGGHQGLEQCRDFDLILYLEEKVDQLLVNMTLVRLQ